MSTLTITFDPDDASDVARVRALLDRIAPADPSSLDPDLLRQKIIALLRGYGETRTAYIREVAQAAPGTASYDDLLAIVGSAKGLGGTHSAIERNWRAKGMFTPFIVTHPSGDSSMDPWLADLVLSVLHDSVDEPDPLLVSAF
jgi:hypothetical protein